MDFLEGALLGPLWSDTDYEDRSHRLMGFLYIALVYASLLWVMRQPTIPRAFGGFSFMIWAVATAFFVVVSSFLASRYYHMALGGRFFVLAVSLFKYGVATGTLLAAFRPLYLLETVGLKEKVLYLLDATAGNFVFRAAQQFRVVGLIMSGFLVAIVGVALLVLLTSLILALPVLYLRLIRMIQCLADEALLRLKDRV